MSLFLSDSVVSASIICTSLICYLVRPYNKAAVITNEDIGVVICILPATETPSLFQVISRLFPVY